MYRPDQVQRGMKRLMLRLPALRQRLRELVAEEGEAQLLCGAFDEAAGALDELRKRNAATNILEEYEEICAEIEEDLLRLCSRSRRV